MGVDGICIPFILSILSTLKGCAVIDIQAYDETRFESLVALVARLNPEPHFDACRALHPRLFPRTYATAQQSLDKRTEHSKVFMAVEDGRLQGYIVASVEPGAGAGYTDFVGVAEDARRREVGRRLLAAALHWMFSFPEVQRTDLTVTATKAAALGLYAGLGYRRERLMRAYRKTDASA
jgi:ribosomal protein S18 acetylase RimI-like enzyme